MWTYECDRNLFVIFSLKSKMIEVKHFLVTIAWSWDFPYCTNKLCIITTETGMGILFKDYCNIEIDPQFIGITVNTKEQANEMRRIFIVKGSFPCVFSWNIGS